jgi:hypothetical protein
MQGGDVKRHGVPSTITSTGRVVQSWTPGPDNALPPPSRYLEAWRRFRRKHNRRTSARLLVAAWRHGFALS